MRNNAETNGIWELAEKIYVQLQVVPNTKIMTTSQLVKHSVKIAEEFYDQRLQANVESLESKEKS